MVESIRELNQNDFARAMPRRQRERIVCGEIDPAKDIVALRRCTGLTQGQFAEALSISIHTPRNWELGRRKPEGPAFAPYSRNVIREVVPAMDDFARSVPRRQRERIIRGEIDPAKDILALRRFTG